MAAGDHDSIEALIAQLDELSIDGRSLADQLYANITEDKYWHYHHPHCTTDRSGIRHHVRHTLREAAGLIQASPTPCVCLRGLAAWSVGTGIEDILYRWENAHEAQRLDALDEHEAALWAYTIRNDGGDRDSPAGDLDLHDAYDEWANHHIDTGLQTHDRNVAERRNVLQDNWDGTDGVLISLRGWRYNGGICTLVEKWGIDDGGYHALMWAPAGIKDQINKFRAANVHDTLHIDQLHANNITPAIIQITATLWADTGFNYNLARTLQAARNITKTPHTVDH